jgi:hypothetical protein
MGQLVLSVGPVILAGAISTDIAHNVLAIISALLLPAMISISRSIFQVMRTSIAAAETSARLADKMQLLARTDVVTGLLDDFLDAMDPLYQEAKQKGRPAGAYLLENKGRMAEGLLAVTDRKAQRAEGMLKKAYDKLRPLAKGQVESAAPRLSQLLEKHAEKTA